MLRANSTLLILMMLLGACSLRSPHEFSIVTTMTNQVLGNLAIEEIRKAMYGLRGPIAKYEAERLAKFYNISVSRVYDITRDLRPKRKRRTDKGTRAADLLENDGLRYAAELVVLE